MAINVLVADDSLTIQKVIGITLANSDYELVQCTDEKDLLDKLRKQHFDLLLLDFNLSDDQSGYELCEEIKTISPEIAILAMLGTFDSVDDDRLLSSGIGDKIVKPFESGKFVQKCQKLVEDNKVFSSEDRPSERDEIQKTNERPQSDDENNNFVEREVQSENDEEGDIGDDWVVNAPQIEEETSEIEIEHEEFKSDEAEDSSNENPLQTELEGWGMEVPGVIGNEGNDCYTSLPPRIEEHEHESVNVNARASSSVDAGVSEEVTTPTSSLIPMEELVSEEVNNEVDQIIEKNNEVKNMDLASEVNSSDESSDDFWSIDEDVIDDNNEGPTIIQSVSDSKIALDEDCGRSEQNDLRKESVKCSNDSLESKREEPKNDIDIDEVSRRVGEQISPIIEKLVREICSQQVEKIAWEVIPDLAENLIRKEITEISKSVNG